MFDLTDCADTQKTSFRAKSVRLGTYAYNADDEVTFTSKGIRLIAPNTKRPEEKCVLNIQKKEIVKILFHFGSPSIIVIFVLNSCTRYVREEINMNVDDKGMS